MEQCRLYIKERELLTDTTLTLTAGNAAMELTESNREIICNSTCIF